MPTDPRESRLARRIADLSATDPQFAAARPDEAIGAAIDSGDLLQNVGLVLPITEAVKAHRMLEGELPRPKGKIVLKVRD